ncbi:MAG TPA: ribosome maturation factor RimM [Gaiellaceae bacterium]|nr:ribosome maturation factor RimM [Gaiellaceae bacterium]
MPTSESFPGWVTVGRVGRPHGVDGSFVVERPSADPTRFDVGARVYVEREPARIEDSKRAGGRRLVIRLDRPVARGAVIEVSIAELSPPEEGAYYVFQLVGLAAEDEDGRPLGTVVDVAPGVANDVVELDSGLLLPLVAECVRTVDLEGGRIVIAPGFADPG